MILAGDVGGTKVHLALYGFTEGKLTHVRDEKFPSGQYDGLEVVVREFLSRDGAKPEITAACFGVPGPVREHDDHRPGWRASHELLDQVTDGVDGKALPASQLADPQAGLVLQPL